MSLINENAKTSELVFIEFNYLAGGYVNANRLDVIAYHDPFGEPQIDLIKFYISSNIRTRPPIFDFDKSAPFVGLLNVHEIVTPSGYIFANDRSGILDVVNPFYELKRDYNESIKHYSCFTGTESDVNLRLCFNSNERGELIATLYHDFPSFIHQNEIRGRRHDRKFTLLGVESGRKLEEIKLI